MKFDLIRLKSGMDIYIPIDLTYTFSKEELKDTEIISLENVSIVGEITKNSFDEYEVSAHLQGTMVLPCSVTLKPVNVPFDVEMEQNVSDFIEETGEKSIICENTLDIFPIIWENILMEIPMKVVSDDISDRTLSGNGWKVISGNEEPEKNPELEKLKDLL